MVDCLAKLWIQGALRRALDSNIDVPCRLSFSDGFLEAHLLHLDERVGWLVRLLRQVECVLAGLSASENRVIEAFQKQLDEVTDLLRLRFGLPRGLLRLLVDS